VRDNKGLSLTSIKKGTYSTALVVASDNGELDRCRKRLIC